MLRLISSSDPDEVRRDKLRWKFEERVVLTSAVCRELMATVRGAGYRRSQVALALLEAWMISNYDSPHDWVKFDFGLDDPDLEQVASDLAVELKLGSAVCRNFDMLMHADTQREMDSDKEDIRRSLADYSAHVGVAE